MRIIIAGTRTSVNMDHLEVAIQKSGWTPKVIISGTAKGADQLGEQWARENSVPVKQFKPDWSQYGKAAGPKRNREMAENADALIALWDGKSKGTKNMIETAEKLGLKVYVHRIK